ELEATTTEIVVRIVQAGRGVSVVPLMPDGSVTGGRRVGVRRLGEDFMKSPSGNERGMDQISLSHVAGNAEVDCVVALPGFPVQRNTSDLERADLLGLEAEMIPWADIRRRAKYLPADHDAGD